MQRPWGVLVSETNMLTMKYVVIERLLAFLGDGLRAQVKRKNLAHHRLLHGATNVANQRKVIVSAKAKEKLSFLVLYFA